MAQRALVAVAATLLLTLGGAKSASAWQIDLDTGTTSDDIAEDVEIAPDGDPVIAGRLGGHFTVTKRDAATGHEIWLQTIHDGSGAADGSARALKIDAAGDVYAAGYALNGVFLQDVAVAKLDGATGAVLWQTMIDGLGVAIPTRVGQNDAGFDLVLDGMGGLFVAGTLDTWGATYNDFAVVKLDDSSGGVIWSERIDGSYADTPQFPMDVAVSITVDEDGNPVAAGDLNNNNPNANGNISLDFTVVKFEGLAGGVVWQREIDVTSEDEARDVLMDEDWDVFVGGRFGHKVAIVKLIGLTGATIWTEASHGNYPAWANEIALTADGDVIAAGGMDTGTITAIDFIVGRWRGGNGLEVWFKTFNTADDEDDARALSLDTEGNVYAAGYRELATGGHRGMWIRRLDPLNGNQAWETSVGLPNNSGQQYAESINAQADGSVYVGGRLDNPGTGMDFTVLKLASGTGGPPISLPTGPLVPVGVVAAILATFLIRRSHPRSSGPVNPSQLGGGS